MTSFNDWLNIREDVPVVPTTPAAAPSPLPPVNNVQNQQMDQKRIVNIANSIAAFYKQMPPQQRMAQFIKDFTLIKPKIVQAIQTSSTMPLN